MIAIVILGLVVLWAVLWALLDRHEKRRAAAGQPRHSALRLAFAAAVLLILLFSGGCGLLFLVNQDNQYVTWQAVAIVAGPPFAISLLVLWLALTRNNSIYIGVAGLAALFVISAAGVRVMHAVVAGPNSLVGVLAIAALITGVTGAIWWTGRGGRLS